MKGMAGQNERGCLFSDAGKGILYIYGSAKWLVESIDKCHNCDRVWPEGVLVKSVVSFEW